MTLERLQLFAFKAKLFFYTPTCRIFIGRKISPGEEYKVSPKGQAMAEGRRQKAELVPHSLNMNLVLAVVVLTSCVLCTVSHPCDPVTSCLREQILSVVKEVSVEEKQVSDN